MAVLSQYNFNSGLAASSNDASITASVVTNIGCFSLVSGAAGYATNVLIANPGANAISQATAVSNNSYFYFTVTPTPGQTMNLTSLVFNAARGGASTPRGYVIRSSVDNFATNIAAGDLLSQRTVFNAHTIDLSGASFQGLNGSVTFRVYIYGPSTGVSIDMDDLTVNGTIGNAAQLVQRAYRFRNDDGSETTATWINTENNIITMPKNTNVRIRIGINATLNIPPENLQVEYKKTGGSWIKI